MPVGTATRHDPEKIGERSDPFCVFGEVTRMPDFNSIEPNVDHRLESLAATFLRRVSPDGNRTR